MNQVSSFMRYVPGKLKTKSTPKSKKIFKSIKKEYISSGGKVKLKSLSYEQYKSLLKSVISNLNNCSENDRIGLLKLKEDIEAILNERQERTRIKLPKTKPLQERPKHIINKNFSKVRQEAIEMYWSK
ncbi:TPA: hypothetical protein ACY4R4_002872 [Clostridium perfringens]